MLFWVGGAHCYEREMETLCYAWWKGWEGEKPGSTELSLQAKGNFNLILRKQ